MKTILITGVSKGIGRSLAKKAMELNGVRVIGLARSQNDLDSLFGELNGNSNLSLFKVDISDKNEVDAFIKKLNNSCVSINLLINNAGSLVNKPFEEITYKELSCVYNINVLGLFYITQQLLPLLKNTVNSHVLNITSMGGLTGTAKFPGLSAYSSSKGAVSVLTECLAEEFNGKGIHFNALALGAVQTTMLSEAFPGFKAPVTPEEITDFILDFGLKYGNIFNGKIIQVASTTP